MRHAALAIAGVIVLAAAPASAQGVQIAFHDGYVSLSARNATAGEILAEWARLGQTHVVNADRVPGGPLTLEFQHVPEQRALETVLRAASGYVVAARLPGVPGASAFERIMVMPPSTAARAAAPLPPPVQTPQPQPVDPNAEPLTDDQGEPVAPPGFESDYDDEQPAPGRRRPFAPGMRGGIDPLPEESVEPPADEEAPTPGRAPLYPGTLTSPSPSVLPVPRRQQPQ